MTDRGVPATDGSSACPFVAYEDDRDERADRPDHRHRCYAESVPAPRALAHQEAYCLSSAFPVCPTFQEWAQREAAHAQPGQARAVHDAHADAAVGEAAGAVAPDESEDEPDDLWSGGRDVPVEDRPRRNPPRDWAAPPPWAGAAGAAAAGAGASAGAAAASSRGQGGAAPDVPGEGRGLAGSSADRVARGADPDRVWLDNSPPARPSPDAAPSSASAPADPELAGLVGRRAVRAGERAVDDEPEVAPRPTRRPAVSSTRDRSRERERDRERERAADDRGHDGPAWERRRRYEAYPSIKLRAGLTRIPPLPRIAVLFGALLVAALLLFLLPSILNLGGRVGTPGAVASESAAVPSESVEPTPTPVPTPVVYTIKPGDTLTKIAKRYSLTLDQLLEANKDTISNPNRIKVGDRIVIPTPPPEEVPAEESPSAEASVAP